LQIEDCWDGHARQAAGGRRQPQAIDQWKNVHTIQGPQQAFCCGEASLAKPQSWAVVVAATSLGELCCSFAEKIADAVVGSKGDRKGANTHRNTNHLAHLVLVRKRWPNVSPLERVHRPQP
jgi:hypothetical protein